jgi:glutamyl-Q tRNA(Asp) synthetase
LGYTGRFAPSPTGQLHLGSLTTAVASYLEARTRGGRWLLRIDDLDTQRCVPGLADEFLVVLEQLGFEWDGQAGYQSLQTQAYAAALEHLQGLGLTYPCGCTRRELAESTAGQVYAGHCRERPRGAAPYAVRFRGDDTQSLQFDDGLQGRCEHRWIELGDPIIQRRDRLIAYQLAVVVDDELAGVTDVVRGMDLLTSTPWQLALQRALNINAPRYVHLPLVVNADGSKLSKSAHAIAIDSTRATATLHQALRLLRMQPPQELCQAPPASTWAWAFDHWHLDSLYGQSQLPVQHS